MTEKREKTGGRTVGTPNKGTTVIRQRIKEYLDSEIENVFEDIKTLEPKDRVNFYFKMLNYVVPTIRPLERGETEKPLLDFNFGTGELID